MSCGQWAVGSEQETVVSDFSLKGCKIVAGGQSVA